jgi:hypothetical protein
MAPLDYGPVLLLMPFGFHLAVDTLPSGCLPTERKPRPLPWLSPPFPASCPFRVFPIHVPRPARHYPRLRIWRPSSERHRDSNPPDLRAAQRTLRDCPTPHGRSSTDYDLRPSRRAPGRHHSRRTVGSPSSCAKSVRACRGSMTAPGPSGTRDSAPSGVAFRLTQRRRHRESRDFAARWLACTSPCQRFSRILADTAA